MSPRAVLAAALSAAVPLLALSCERTGLGPKPPITSAMLDAGRDALASESDAESTAKFFACVADGDCVPVPKNSCCDNGFKEAVNRNYVEAYKASFTCATKEVCPLFRVEDTRTARCAASKCELDRPAGAHELPTPH